MLRFWLFSTALLGALGCGNDGGPDLVEVEGTITMNGEPVTDASVKFSPDGAGAGGFTSPAYGMTDKNGYYSLAYSISKTGANPGKYKVSINTQTQADPDQGIKARPETVPAKYNKKTELTVEVKAGGGPYDFKLDSEGPVIQTRESQ